MGRAVVTGAVLGFLVVETVMSTVALLAGVDLVGALAIGTFAALWDGLGMGAMFAAVRYAQRPGAHASESHGHHR